MSLGQPQGGGYSCILSSAQPSDPTDLSSIIVKPYGGIIYRFIHTEKVQYDCRPAFVPPQPRFNMHTTIVTNLYPLQYISASDVHFNVTMCRISLQGVVISCSTPPIPFVKYGYPFLPFNITGCTELAIQHNSDSRSVTFADFGNYNDPLIQRDALMMSETHLYKCNAGQVQIADKIKVMTLFTLMSGPTANSRDMNSVKTMSYEVSCIEDIRSGRVESCQARAMPGT